jgi:hypothetical protein
MDANGIAKGALLQTAETMKAFEHELYVLVQCKAVPLEQLTVEIPPPPIEQNANTSTINWCKECSKKHHC